MSNEIPDPHDVPTALETGTRALRERNKTLNIHPHGLERLVEHSMDYLALLLDEADRIARSRRGDDIQTGDVDLANEVLASRGKGRYWGIAAGSALLGVGLAGLADTLLSKKETTFVLVYSIAIVLGTIVLYMGSPRR